MSEITDQVIDFYNALFERIFFKPFSGRIPERRRRDAVRFQVLEAAGAASQSLERFFSNQQLTPDQVKCVLGPLHLIHQNLSIEQVANPYTPPERIVDDLLQLRACSSALDEVAKVRQEAVYRVALYSIVQGLMQVGPVMAEWQNIGFPTTFELSRRVIARLNEISAQLDVLGKAGSEAADERYELQYRDYLSQRFYRIEAGTVRMTTNLSVDLRELFIMPNVLERVLDEKGLAKECADSTELMPLSQARKVLAGAFASREGDPKERTGVPVLEQVTRQSRNVLVGAPGSGKSTFLEWFQLKVASAEEPYVLADQQAIPLLLRVRQLDPNNLPANSAMVEKATASKDLAALMPSGWIHRQMSDGKIVLMLDGLDEVEPHVRDTEILPWFVDLCKRYPKCSFIVSSRPVGYPAGLLRKLKFSESELLDFTQPQITEYTRHWCTAIRLARNETLAEARREGVADGDRIVSGFEGHPYIKSLARNPLMLSAICLVNYFEGGQLPKDRSVLYRLCVEGLLHNWDQRRGILSDFTFEEKLRACRELALHMQAQDRAECDLASVQEVFSVARKNSERAASLLEHVRYRTGLLLERRPGVFAFAHLTFQEYLAARAIHEGNQLGIDIERLLQEHGDARWQEVIALYCGLAPAPAAKRVIEGLAAQASVSSSLLAEAYLSARPELAQEIELQQKVIWTIANKCIFERLELSRFPVIAVAPIANSAIGKVDNKDTSEAFHWLHEHPSHIDFGQLLRRLKNWSKLPFSGVTELSYLVHRNADDDILIEVAKDSAMYASPVGFKGYESQAEAVFESLAVRERPESDVRRPGADAAWVQTLKTIANAPLIGPSFGRLAMPSDILFSQTAWPECAPLIERLVDRLRVEGVKRAPEFEKWYKSLKIVYEPQAGRPASKPSEYRQKKLRKKVRRTT